MANLKFYKKATAPVGTTEKPIEAGAVWFNTTNHTIEVFTGSKWEVFTGAINAVVEGEKLTITNYDGSKVSVDFSIYATDEALELLAGRVSTLEGTVAGHGESISGLSGRMTTVEGKAATAEGQLAGLTETTVMAEIAKQVKVEADRALEAEGKLAERVTPLETASADYEERIGVLESFISGGEEGESVQDLIDAAIEKNNTDVVTPGLAAKADKATYEAYVAANDAAVAAVKKTAEDEVTRATAAEAGLQEQIGTGFSKDATVAAAVKSAQDAADAAQKTIDDFLTGEGVDPNKVDALKDIITYMETHGTQYQDVVDNLDTLNTDVAALQGKVDVEKVSEAIAAAKEEVLGVITENEKTTAAALTELDGRVDALEALELGTVVEDFEGRIAANEAAVATVDSRIATAKSGAEATAAADATYKANTAESNAKGYADGLIAAEVTRSNKYADDAVAVEAAKVAANTAAISALDAKVTEGLAWVEFE